MIRIVYNELTGGGEELIQFSAMAMHMGTGESVLMQAQEVGRNSWRVKIGDDVWVHLGGHHASAWALRHYMMGAACQFFGVVKTSNASGVACTP